MSTTGHENEAINVQGLKASLQKLKTENLDPNVNKGIVNEATCSTAAGTAAKTVTAPASFSLTSGAAILVKFTNGISVDNATLAVGSTAAKPIYYKGAALEADYVEAGDIIMLKYDGTNYNVVGKLGGRALPEVQIGGTAPTSESEIKLFVDENSDDTVEVYTKAQANILYAGKTDKLPMTGTGAATENNFMAIDANGNIKDSGKNANSFLTQHQSIKTINGASIVGTGNVDLQTPLTFDSTPTAGSINPVTSSGILKGITDNIYLSIKRAMAVLLTSSDYDCVKINSSFNIFGMDFDIYSQAGDNYVHINFYLKIINDIIEVKRLSIKHDGSNGKLNIYESQGNITLYYDSNDKSLYIRHSWNTPMTGFIHSEQQEIMNYTFVSNPDTYDFSGMTKVFDLLDYNGQESF